MSSKTPSFLEQYPRQLIAYIACIALFGGLIFSKFLITVSMILFIALAVASPTLKDDLKVFSSNKSYWAGIGIFLLFGISALMSTNGAEAMVRLRIILPLLFLPIAFALLPKFSKRKYQELLSIFLYAMLIACIGVLINFLMNYAEMQQRLIVSDVIPTPNGEHIRFSLMINLAIFAGFWLLQERFSWKDEWAKLERILLGATSIFFMIMLHLLSVRIGIVVLYGGLLVTVFYYILVKKRYLIGLGLIICGVSIPFIAYKTVPSIKTKVNLTLHNLYLWKKGHIGEYSDTRRLLSFQIAWQVAQQSPWIGVGVGDLNDEQTKIYQAEYPDQKVMYPHNFFLTLYAATGLLGLLFFLLCFFFPLFYRRNYKNLFFLLLHVTIFLSFMTENTLFSAIGVGIYSFFLPFSLNYLDKEKTIEEN